MKYNNAMKLAVSELSRRKPHKFALDVIEYPDYLGLRIYENEIMGMNDSQRENVFNFILMVRDRLEELGNVKVYPEGVPGDPAPKLFTK